MSEYREDTKFLRRIIGYGDTEEHRELEKKIAQLQRDEHCVQRVALAAVHFTLAAMVGLAYEAIFGSNFPYSESQLWVTILLDLGVASLICLVGFVVLLMVYRTRLNRLREECRHSVLKLVELRLGRSLTASLGKAPSESVPGEIANNSAKADDPLERGSSFREVKESKNPNDLSAA